MIKTGEMEEEIIVTKEVEVSGGFLGFGKKTETRKIRRKRRKTMTIETRFNALEAQIRDYDQLMQFLQHHKVAYQRFFIDLSGEIEAVVQQKCRQLQAVEERRHQLEQKAQQKQNQQLHFMAQQQKRELLESIVLLDKATILMLKKIALIRAGIDKLTNDNELQKQVLLGLMEEIQDYKEAVEIQREINKIKQDIAEMTEVALNFEQYLEKYLGPFQALVNDAAKVDQDIAKAIEEIRNLAEDLLVNEGGFFSLQGAEAISESILNFSITSYEKQTQLSDAQVAQTSIAESLEKIQVYLRQRLETAVATVTLELEAQGIEENTSLTFSAPLTEDGETLNLDLGRGIIIEMVQIPAGVFHMGSPEGIGRDKEKPQHLVKIAQPFYMGKYPVTQAQYEAVMGKNPAYFANAETALLSKGGWGDHPVSFRVSLLHFPRLPRLQLRFSVSSEDFLALFSYGDIARGNSNFFCVYTPVLHHKTSGRSQGILIEIIYPIQEIRSCDARWRGI